VSYQTARQRTLTPGEVAAIPRGHGLLVRGASWGLVATTRYYDTPPWSTLARGADPARALPPPQRDMPGLSSEVGVTARGDVRSQGLYAAQIGRRRDAAAAPGVVIATDRRAT
jgi:hypothetical protein